MIGTGKIPCQLSFLNFNRGKLLGSVAQARAFAKSPFSNYAGENQWHDSTGEKGGNITAGDRG